MTTAVPELAVRPGCAPPGELPRGDFIWSSLADGTIRIDHADPRILISAELLDAICDDPPPHAWLDLAGCTTYDGGLLKISGVNRTVIYRLVSYVPAVRGYIAEWPD
jgi:hypothetical protein